MAEGVAEGVAEGPSEAVGENVFIGNNVDEKQLENIIRLHYLTKTNYNLVNNSNKIIYKNINWATYYVMPYVAYIIYIVVFCFFTTISYMKSTYSVPWLLIHFLSQPTRGILDLFLGFPQFISTSGNEKEYNDSYWVDHNDLIRYIILTLNIYLIPSYIQYLGRLFVFVDYYRNNNLSVFIENENWMGYTKWFFKTDSLFVYYNLLIIAVVVSAFTSAINQHGHYIALLVFTGLTILIKIISSIAYSYNRKKYPPEFDYIFSFSFGEYWTLYYVCIIVLLFMMPITSKLEEVSESNKILKENFDTINNITNFTQNKKYLAVLILILLIILTIINSNNKNSMYSGGGIGINTFNNKLNFLFGIILLYIIYKTYTQSNIHTNKKKNKIKGGSDLSFEVKTTDQTDSNIVFYVSCIVVLISLYMNNLVYSNDIINYINNKFLNYSNLSNLRLLVFPITVIIIFLTLFGYPFIKTFIVRQIEQESVINIEKYDSGRGGVGRTGANAEQGKTERQLEQKYSNKLIDNDEKNILTYHSFIAIKYTSYIIIILWYTYLFYTEKIELNTMLLFNLVILYIYFYFIQYVVYIFFKIYMNENVNKIDSQIKTINKIKTKIKFVEGKINPVAFEEIVEINSSKLKEQYEEFINTLFRNLKDILRMNNLNNLTTAIEQLIMTRLANNKKLKDDFDLEQSIIENRKIEMEKRRKLNVKKPLPPIPENQIMKLNLSGKWTNIKDENYIILYVYNSNAMVLYFNKTQYQGFKLMEIHQKSGLYEFIYKNELEFTYDNKNIIINGIPHSKLSDEFATPENIIKKTLNDNNIFKSLNYMVSIDEDAEFIGKYKLVENITNYNNYKGKNDKLSVLLEQMIMNKILLIKSIKNKKYKQAHVYSQEIDKLEKQYKKREAFYKFDTDNDGIISISEIQNYKKKNHKLSDIGEVKIVSATYHGGDIYLKFDKKITNHSESFQMIEGGKEYKENEGQNIVFCFIPYWFLLGIDNDYGNSKLQGVADGGMQSAVDHVKDSKTPANEIFNNYINYGDGETTKAMLIPSELIQPDNTLYSKKKNNSIDTNGVSISTPRSHLSIINFDTIKIKVKDSIKDKINKTNNIKIKINYDMTIFSGATTSFTSTEGKIQSSHNSGTANFYQTKASDDDAGQVNGGDKTISISKFNQNKSMINLRLKQNIIKVKKTINNFAEFDPTIFDP